ncbi:MAG: SRPBCC domain-containing protein [Methylococcales bacterium]|nr:MAG: SRPBCC domain-containing protein [Methylococcales bacterium]
MYEIRTEIEIDATPEQVWSILINFIDYPQWNPFVRSITGIAKMGEQLTVLVQPTGAKAMTFRPKVLNASPNHEFRWLGHFLLPGIFDGEHYFIIEAISSERVRFIHSEKFTGLLVKLFKSSLETATKQGFIAMNEALKLKVEKS